MGKYEILYEGMLIPHERMGRVPSGRDFTAGPNLARLAEWAGESAGLGLLADFQ